MLDPGHGGKDTGCQNSNVTEKELTLKISQQLATVLKNKGYRVSLTRSDDRYLRLDERTGIANRLEPDLFVSIHINASTDAASSGIETFCLSQYLFEHKHGHHHTQKANGADHYHTARTLLYEQSDQAAQDIHRSLMANVHTAYPHVRDRQVQYKVPQVLFGVHAPAVLLELGFLSHTQEAKLLMSPAYQKLLVQGIAQGIDAFFLSKTK